MLQYPADVKCNIVHIFCVHRECTALTIAAGLNTTWCFILELLQCSSSNVYTNVLLNANSILRQSLMLLDSLLCNMQVWPPQILSGSPSCSEAWGCACSLGIWSGLYQGQCQSITADSWLEVWSRLAWSVLEQAQRSCGQWVFHHSPHWGTVQGNQEGADDQLHWLHYTAFCECHPHLPHLPNTQRVRLKFNFFHDQSVTSGQIYLLNTCV